MRYHFTRLVGTLDCTSTGDGRRLDVQDPKEVVLGILGVRRVLGVRGLFVYEVIVKVEKKKKLFLSKSMKGFVPMSYE